MHQLTDDEVTPVTPPPRREWIVRTRDGAVRELGHTAPNEPPVCAPCGKTPVPAPTYYEPDKRECGGCGATFEPAKRS